MPDVRQRFDPATAIDGRLNVDVLCQTPVALDHGIGRVDAIDDNRDARASEITTEKPSLAEAANGIPTSIISA